MSKVLLLGICPLPIEQEEIMSALGIRTWQFTKSLLGDGHEICLVCSQRPGSYGKNGVRNSEIRKLEKRLIFHSLSQEQILDLAYLQKIYDELQPDCIVSAGSSLLGYAVVQIKSNVPIWIDQCGELTAEAQMKAFIEKDNKHLCGFLKIDKQVLEKGDVFSSISPAQRYALIGKLGMSGRLNKDTVGYEFAYVIPSGVDYVDDIEKSTAAKRIIPRGSVKEDDFVVLWSGSYNTWTNVDVLFSALEKAMANNEKIKFVSTGGNVPLHNEITYSYFLKLIGQSRFKEKFIMLGWIPTRDMVNLYLESNLGINIDRPCYEAELGCRTRVLGWMGAGLPVLTTKFCELTKILEKNKLGFIFPAEDAEALSNSILGLSFQKGLLKEYAQRAKNFVRQEFSYENTTRPLRAWVNNPSHSLDRIKTTQEITTHNNMSTL
ncbi:MAG: glycosyltransferase [Candidatus Omnitrophota bacterium]|jgi:glycosyltransferase involved in cell wall biosynthesis